MNDADVFIVDDNPKNLALLSEVLRGAGFRVRAADSGRRALLMLEALTPDLIMLDIQMPDMNGYELCERLKTDPNLRIVPVIFISALDDLTDKVEAFRRGGVDYVTKPFQAEEVVARARAHVELYQLRRELSAKNELLVSIFGRYVSHGVAEELLQAPNGLRLGGTKRKVTMLMSDLRGFSELCDQLPPESVIHLLNYYLSVMTQVVTAYLGIIDEIIGDGIFVVFGAPIKRPDDADRAVACALAMQEAMELVNAWQRAHGYPNLEMGIAVNTGEVIVGNIGSEERSKYGVVGSQVNLTSRIESFTVGDQILVSEMTRAAMQAELEYDGEITIHPKGTAEPLQVFSARGIGGPFNVRIPERQEPLRELPNPIEVRFQTMMGTVTSPVVGEGRIARLSSREADLETPAEVDLYSDLRLVLLSPEGSVLGDRLFAKVVGTRPGLLRLRFTAKGEKEELLLAKVRSA